jgi:hypothetical protein
MDLQATREPSSPVVANVRCGNTLLLIDQRFGSAHLRTEDGKDGYIVEVKLGQYALQPVSESGTLSRSSGNWSASEYRNGFGIVVKMGEFSPKVKSSPIGKRLYSSVLRVASDRDEEP